MKKLILCSLILLVSCSSLRKSLIYGGLAGSAIGIVGGHSLSPDKESVQPNMAIWGSLGALMGAGLGYLFYTDDPENRELPQMILPQGGNVGANVKRKEFEVPSIKPSDSKKYKLETGPLPEHLKGKVKSPFIIEHEIPETVEQMENGKTITVESHKAWEVSYE